MLGNQTHEIGMLCVGGDWACAHGDFSALRDIAHRLSAYTREPTHCRLVELADACLSDPDRAATLWARVKHTLVGSA